MCNDPPVLSIPVRSQRLHAEVLYEGLPVGGNPPAFAIETVLVLRSLNSLFRPCYLVKCNWNSPYQISTVVPKFCRSSTAGNGLRLFAIADALMNSFVVPALAQKELAARLGQAHRFNSKDLAKNVEGTLSAHQWLRLIAEAFHPFLRAVAGAALLLTCLAGVYSLISKQNKVDAIIYIALGVLALGMAATLLRLFKLGMDYWKGQVWQVTGRLNVSWEDQGRGLVNSSETGSRSRAVYRYTVAGEEFVVDDRVYRLLADHFELGYPTVSLYYTPHTRRVMSLHISGMESTLAPIPQSLRPKPPQQQEAGKNPGLWRY